MRAKWFWCVFKLGFFQLIWKASLIFKPLSILLQQCLLQNLGVVILDHKLYDNTIQEIISVTSKFKILNEDPNLKHQASLQLFLRKLKQKNFFNKIEYDKLYPSVSSPAYIYGTPKIHQFSSSDSFPKLGLIVSSTGAFNYNIACFL